jgi:hypothetical protein
MNVHSYYNDKRVICQEGAKFDSTQSRLYFNDIIYLMNVTIPLGVGAVCFILSYWAFHSYETGLGFLFAIFGFTIVLLGLVFSSKSRRG